MQNTLPTRRSESIVRPVCNASTPSLGPAAVIAASAGDHTMLKEVLNPTHKHMLYMSRLDYSPEDKGMPALVGPVMGAPYAAMLLEILHAWGVATVVFWGWCGAIDETYATGDVIVPQGAFVDEGTSLQYEQSHQSLVAPDDALSNMLRTRLEASGLAVKPGLIWTTDAIFRETLQRVALFREKGACAVEMEFSALCAVAAFRGIALTGVLVVSDELFTGEWKPGFRNERFVTSRKVVASVLSAFHQYRQPS